MNKRYIFHYYFSKQNSTPAYTNASKVIIDTSLNEIPLNKIFLSNDDLIETLFEISSSQLHTIIYMQIW